MLVYNVQDESYYDCSVSTYTAGYFAPEYIDEAGMNVIVVDAFDWANRIGDQTGNPDGQSELYEGVIAHELEHLLMNYSDPGEVSWVDEGLADLAVFLNGYDIGGSHLTYHQVFHRETSLTRWGGGLENYGASFTYFLYLWEQAGGNGDGTYAADRQYDDAGGDLLIKLIFQNAADGMEGVQAAIDAVQRHDPGTEPALRRGAVQGLGDRRQARRRGLGPLEHQQHRLRRPGLHRAGRSTSPTTCSGTAVASTSAGCRRRAGRTTRTSPPQSALPFGVSYETFRNLGREIGISLRGLAHRAGGPAHRGHPLVGWRREPEREHPRRRQRVEPLPVPSWTSGPGTSSRTAGTTATSRRWSTVSG